MYQALYRAYRPEIFDEILGQEHIVKILKNQLAADTVSHAYLFCGTRGTGKTTTARILAKGLNCTSEGERPCGRCQNCEDIRDGNFIDVIEIDAASNNGVDNIRELRESVKYPPAAGRKKIYIIDEVHMLSQGAFNALLKTLEEPPESVVFILATTEPQKLPATILSRCMRLDFRRVPERLLKKGMAEICGDRGIIADDAALSVIAANADGSVRDGLSILDQCLAGGQTRVTREDVLEFLGTSGTEVFIEMTEYMISGKTAEALLLLSRILADGKDVRQFMKDWLEHYRGLLISKFVRNPEDILAVSSENIERLKEQSAKLDVPEINEGILELSRTISEAKWSTQPRVLLELSMVKLSGGRPPVESAGKGARPQKERISSAGKEEQAEKSGNAVLAEREKRADNGRSADFAKEQEPIKSSGEPVRQAAKEGDFTEKDLEILWHRIFEDGESIKTSFNLIRNGTQLVSVTPKEFTVIAAGDLKVRYVKENRETLEALMEKHTGVRRKLICKTPKEENENKGVDIEELRSVTENTLGIKVTIE